MLLEVRNVEVVYNRFFVAVKNLSFGVEEGRITALLGPNGAGKSTILKAISGLIQMERGEVTRGAVVLDDRDITSLDPEIVYTKGVVHVLEGHRIFKELTTEENLTVVARDRADLEQVFTYFPRLRERRAEQAGYLSGGEQQMLVIGRALLSRPRLLLIDEPSLGLAPLFVKILFETITRISQERGISILLSEQNAAKALQIADYAYVLDHGQMVMEGRADEISRNEDVKEFYLGFGQQSYTGVKTYKRRKRWLF
jgi:branched-chain amino acid transport system ATP-binding protein